jgi:tRNA pseudouridine32 synthase/23S rRNA pseudouridine746 synthase
MIPLLYEDDNILAIDKPAGISSIPERDRFVPSILSILEEQLKTKLFIVHRLDKEVSGCMLFAKTAEAHRRLNEKFFERSVSKTYAAVVVGTLEEKHGVIDRPIRQFGSGRMGVDEKQGKPSRTEYEVVERRGETTFINAFPVTGRRHQIRVHFYSIGHPVAGDRRYGEKSIQGTFPRLLLHARRIQCDLSGGREIIVESKLPDIFSARSIK